MDSWKILFDAEREKEYFINIFNFVKQRRKETVVFPSENDLFNAYKITPLENVKVVIIGQDPYHGDNQAHGLCFSVKDGVELPPSLKNIYKEISNEFNFSMSKSGNLSKWAEQGVLLINSCLTVEKGKPNCHQGKGWENFLIATIELLNKNKSNVVYMLWGGNAKKYEKYINKDSNLILTSVHPSPLSCYNGFFGCNHFKICNEYLIDNKLIPIDWQN